MSHIPTSAARPTTAPATRRSVLGVPVYTGTSAQLLADVHAAMAQGHCTRVAFANANLLNMAHEDASLRQMLNGFLVPNDGSGVNLASKLLGYGPFPDNLNGTDFLPYFFENSPPGLKIYLLGAAEPVLQEAVAQVGRRWPQHTVVGARNGYFSEAEADSVRAALLASGAQAVLIAMGNGKQERFAQSLSLPGASLFCVGALFDFWSGRVTRAPTWMRKTGIEWIYRLWLEPGRLWRRYVLGNPRFVLRVLFSRQR